MAEEPNEDLSMDDILSSIRNILMEDNAAQQSTSQPEVKAEPVATAATDTPITPVAQDVPIAPVVPVAPITPVAPVAPVAQDVPVAPVLPVVTAPEEDINLDDLPGMDAEDIGLLSSEDEVFDLSPSMIIENTEEKPAAADSIIAAEPEISEDDILNLSSLIPSEPTAVTPQQKPVSAPQEEKASAASAAVPSFEPSIPSPRMNAPLASEVLSEEEVSLESEPEVSLDDIMNLSSLIEKEAPASSEPEDTTVDLSGELDSGDNPLLGLDDADLTPFSIRDAADDNVEKDLSVMTFSEEDNQPMDLAPLGEEAETVDVDSEPIFEPEISAAPEIEPRQVMESISPVQTVVPDEPEEESAIDDATLNEILDFHAQVEETKPAVPTEIAHEPEEVAISEADPTDNIQDVISEPVIEVADAETETVQEPEVVKAEDAADVSANIISNFAKLFAEKKASETPSEPVAAVEDAPAQTTAKTASPSISELVREAVVKQVTQQMEVNFEGYAREAVAAQTQAWLDANLPAIVEAVVSKEIERVMAKVGS